LDTVVLVQHKSSRLLGPGVDRRSARMRLGSYDHRFAAGSFVAIYRAPGGETWAANSDGENAKKIWTRGRGRWCDFRELEAPVMVKESSRE
jgi:hypothetical protein